MMRKISGFLFTLAACLLLEACLQPAPVQPGPAAGDAARHLAMMKPKLMSADYRADLEELARLREEVVPLADDPALGYLAHY